MINNISILGNDVKDPGYDKVIFQEISTHGVHIHPPNKYYLDISTIPGRSLDNLKFEFSTLQICYCNKSKCGHVIVDSYLFFYKVINQFVLSYAFQTHRNMFYTIPCKPCFILCHANTHKNH